MEWYLCSMKYRLLTSEELEIFAEDLKHFLIVNGVHNEEWVEMNASNPDKARDLVALFSDSVLQKVYEKVRFLEHRTLSSCMVFHLLEDEIHLIAINTTSEEVNLSTPEGIHEAMIQKTNLLTFFQTSKKYSGIREAEIHTMLQQGCVNSSEAFWMQLKKALEA